MSKLFYDHLIVLTELEAEIKNIAETIEEKEELWNLVDEIIHHRVLGCVLDNLSHEHHEEFLEKFHERPYDEVHIYYLKEKIGKNVEDLIRNEVNNLVNEIIGGVNGRWQLA